MGGGGVKESLSWKRWKGFEFGIYNVRGHDVVDASFAAKEEALNKLDSSLTF